MHTGTLPLSMSAKVSINKTFRGMNPWLDFSDWIAAQSFLILFSSTFPTTTVTNFTGSLTGVLTKTVTKHVFFSSVASEKDISYNCSNCLHSPIESVDTPRPTFCFNNENKLLPKSPGTCVFFSTEHRLMGSFTTKNTTFSIVWWNTCNLTWINPILAISRCLAPVTLIHFVTSCKCCWLGNKLRKNDSVSVDISEPVSVRHWHGTPSIETITSGQRPTALCKTSVLEIESDSQ